MNADVRGWVGLCFRGFESGRFFIAHIGFSESFCPESVPYLQKYLRATTGTKSAKPFWLWGGWIRRLASGNRWSVLPTFRAANEVEPERLKLRN